MYVQNWDVQMGTGAWCEISSHAGFEKCWLPNCHSDKNSAMVTKI